MKNLMKTAIAAAVTGMLVSPLAMAIDPVDLDIDVEILGLDLDVDVTGLSFGSLWVPGNGGNVVIPADGTARTVAPPMIAGGEAGNPGEFALSNGAPDAVITYTFTSMTANLVRDPTADPVPAGKVDTDMTVTIDSFHEVSGTLDTGATTIQLDNTGAAEFHVGGTLAVNNDQAFGVYNGDIEVTFNY